MATVSQKLAAASGVSVLGMIIDYVGYNPAVSVQSMQTVQGFHNIFVIGTSVCLSAAVHCDNGNKPSDEKTLFRSVGSRALEKGRERDCFR